MNNVSNKDVIQELLGISTKYLGTDIDSNRLSTFGYLTETMANSIEDSIHLSNLRGTNNLIELSKDSEKIRAVAKIRNIPEVKATPAKMGVVLLLRKEDIIANGIKDRLDYTFILDKRSVLKVNDVDFSLINNIVIRAIYHKNKYIFIANYVGETYNEHVVIYNTKLKNGETRLALIVRMEQVTYRTEESVIVDMAQFTYEGMDFEHEKISDFDIYYRLSMQDDYTLLDKHYHRFTTNEPNTILYNDDADNLLLVYNNPNAPLSINGDIKVVFKETLGSGGNFDTTNTGYTFSVYSDDYYKFSGFDIKVEIINDATGGEDGDSVTDLVQKMILRKQSRDILVTDFDIKRSFKNAHNLAVLKKRNDIQFRLFHLYQILRNEKDIVPTTTKTLKLYPDQFNMIHPSSDTKVIWANNKYTLLEEDLAKLDNTVDPVQIPSYENDITKLYMMCPFAYNINSDNILSYYLNYMNKDVNFRNSYVNEAYEYQLIVLKMNIFRNPYSATNHDEYQIRLEGIFNTEDGLEVISEEGEILSTTKVIPYVFFSDGASKVAYLPLTLTEYNISTKTLVFTGTFKSNDYVTEYERLQVTEGLFAAGGTSNYDGVINYKNIINEVVVTFDEPPVQVNDPAYVILGNSTRVISGKFDNLGDSYNMFIECNKFMRSAITILEEPDGLGGTQIYYQLTEVPYIRYSYLMNNIDKLYDELASFELYQDIIQRLSENTINVKFMNTYGKSKHIYIGDNVSLNNLNPVLKFRIYGKNVDITYIKERIRDYFSSFSTEDTYIFVSNINTLIENEFNITSIEFLGVGSFDSSYQKFMNIKDGEQALSYIPEYLNIGDIEIELIENF